jgi:cobalamin biosynthetic protein CobC
VIHGGNLHDAKALFPEAPEPWIDLSTGINPTAYPFPPIDPAAFARLPSVQTVMDLERIAAHAYGVGDPQRVTAAPGSQVLIELLPRLRAKSRVIIVGPTYNEHAACWHRHGHSCTMAETLDTALAERPDVVVVVNPNNPDGRIIGPDDLEKAAAHMAQAGGWLVVDEAFADLENNVSVAHRDLPATVILRSFGKTYGLAGIRLGFVITARDLSATIRNALGLWGISGPALAIGAAAFADTAWLDRQARVLGDAVRRLDDILTRSGCHILGGTLLFRLARHRDAASLFEILARAGIWVRRFPSDASLLRFGIPAHHAFGRLETALRSGSST